MYTVLTASTPLAAEACVGAPPAMFEIETAGSVHLRQAVAVGAGGSLVGPALVGSPVDRDGDDATGVVFGFFGARVVVAATRSTCQAVTRPEVV